MRTTADIQPEALETEMQSIHELIKELLPLIASHLEVAVKIESRHEKEAKEMKKLFDQLHLQVQSRLHKEEFFLFPLLTPSYLDEPGHEGRQMLQEEISRLTADVKVILMLVDKLDKLVIYLNKEVITSQSLASACRELTVLSIKLRELLRIEEQYLFPAVLTHIEYRDKRNFYLTNTYRIMKTIVLPIDYSEASDNATRFAAHLAKTTGASITLLHLYQVPVPPSDAPVIVIPAEELHEENLKMIREYTGKLEEKYPWVNFDAIVKADDVSHGVKEVAGNLQADLIVMAISENDFGHLVFGHNAVNVVNRSPVPVFMIPAGAQFREMKNVVLACDLKDLKRKETLDALKKLLPLFRSKLMMVHVLEDANELPTVEEAATGLRLEHYLEGIDHSLHFPVSEDAVEGISEFAAAHKADLVVMIHHPRGFLKRLFTTQHTKQMSINTNIPLLVLQG